MLGLKNISISEKRTFFFHSIYSTIDGILYGILALNEFVLLKSLKGSEYQVGFLFQLPVIVLLFSIFFNELIKRTRHKKSFLNIFVIITRLPLLLILLFPSNIQDVKIYHQYSFLLILLIYYFSSPIILPMINLFLKQSYTHENFGKYYGLSTSISKIAALISTFLAGFILDINQYFFRYLYLFMAIAGIISIFILTRIDYQNRIPVIKRTLYKSAVDSLKKFKEILTTNKPFLHFQIGFMLYGLAYMGTSGVISIFLNNELGLNYSSLAFYKNGCNTINFLLLPFFGKLLGKTDPRKFAVITFSSLGFFLLFFLITNYVRASFSFWQVEVYYTLIISYIFYGIFSATMGLLWYIGSAYFCKNDEVADYQSIHLSLTGFRGAFAPLIGIYFYMILDFSGVFAAGIIFLVLAVLMMFWSIKKFKQ